MCLGCDCVSQVHNWLFQTVQDKTEEAAVEGIFTLIDATKKFNSRELCFTDPKSTVVIDTVITLIISGLCREGGVFSFYLSVGQLAVRTALLLEGQERRHTGGPENNLQG
ncbi:hypothetical protein H920_18020 [Fukomys damarensis]|uniref:Uncharacterized protein n=1 Tax=Fukomys damarensis TaxID=885580 RepID=A0A091CSV5_FUKDA|nr:hypothetical protein H920_18020 [Fukomys damarensis]